MAINYLFPARAEDLGKRDYWSVVEFSEGEVILDLHVRRWDSERSRWTRLRPGITEDAYEAKPTNDKLLTFGLPLYAPADGVVKSSWRNFPDNPVPGQKLPEVTGEGGVEKTIFTGGNHVVIETDDGRIFTIAHLQEGSVPASLCPTNFDTVVPDTMAKDGEFRAAALIPEGLRPRVEAGTFVGQAGNSGNSSGPHIHISTAPGIGETGAGPKEPIHLIGAWRQDYSGSTPPDEGKWTPFAGGPLNRTVGNSLILPGTYLRLDQILGGGTGESALHFVRSRRVVCALQDSNKNLKLIVCGLQPDGQIVRRGEVEGGAASHIRIAEPRSDLIVIAMRDAAGDLRLISFQVDRDGKLHRRGEFTGGAVSRVAMATVREGLVVTVVRDSQGDCKLIAWQVSPAGTLTRRASAAAGAVNDVVVTAARSASGVVTAVRSGDGNLEIMAWSVTENGDSISRRGSVEAGAASELAIASLGGNDELVVTAVRGEEAEVRLIAWAVSDQGASIQRRGTAIAGPAQEIALSTTRSSSHATVACRDNEGNLRLLSFRLSADGRSINRWGGAVAGSAHQIAIAGTRDSERDYIVTSCADSEANLRLISWEADL